jgi:thioredoxin 1
VVLAGYLVYGYNKMKNIKDVPTSKKIKTLNGKNYKTVIRKGTVLVDFWAPWCAPCKMIAPSLNEIAEEESDTITIAKVNVDQNKELAQKYQIRSIPTLIVFKNGKEQKRIMGVKSKKVILKELGI